MKKKFLNFVSLLFFLSQLLDKKIFQQETYYLYLIFKRDEDSMEYI